MDGLNYNLTGQVCNGLAAIFTSTNNRITIWNSEFYWIEFMSNIKLIESLGSFFENKKKLITYTYFSLDSSVHFEIWLSITIMFLILWWRKCSLRVNTWIINFVSLSRFIDFSIALELYTSQKPRPSKQILLKRAQSVNLHRRPIIDDCLKGFLCVDAMMQVSRTLIIQKQNFSVN